MDRSTTSRSERPTAMRTAGVAALDLLLPAAARERGEPASATQTRRAVHGVAVLRQPSHGRHAAGQSQTNPAAHADSGNRSSLSETEFEPPGARPRDLSVLAARRQDRTTQPRLEHGYYVHSDAGRLPLPRGRDGLVQPFRAQLGTLQHDGDRLLPGRAGGGVSLRPTRDLEFGSRGPVHLCGLLGTAEKTRRVDQHGRTRPRPGQRFHRAAVAQSEVRTRLSRRLRQRRRSLPSAGSILPFLQLSASAPGARLPHAGGPVPAPVNKEKVITMMGGSAPHAPRDLSQFSSRVDGFAFVTIRDCRTMEGLDRRIGQRRDATRAPTQARSGWRPSGSLLVSPLHHLRTAEILSKRWGPPHIAVWRKSKSHLSSDRVLVREITPCQRFANDRYVRIGRRILLGKETAPQ